MLFLTNITKLPLRQALEGAKGYISAGPSTDLPNNSLIQYLLIHMYLEESDNPPTSKLIDNPLYVRHCSRQYLENAEKYVTDRI